eukprot:c46509_g1_i1 orf=29-253(+)
MDLSRQMQAAILQGLPLVNEEKNWAMQCTHSINIYCHISILHFYMNPILKTNASPGYQWKKGVICVMKIKERFW